MSILIRPFWVVLLLSVFLSACGGAKPVGGGAKVPVPTQLTVVPDGQQNTISWAPIRNADATYNLYYSTSPSVSPETGVKIENAPNPYIHRNLTANTIYYYVVTAVVNDRESAPSAVKQSSGATVPMPEQLTVVSNGQQNTISWTPIRNAGATYNLYYSTAPSVSPETGFKIENAPNPYIHQGLTANTIYYYIVTAAVNGQESAPSAVRASGSQSNNPPTGLTVTPLNGGNKLFWNAVSGATYNLYFSTTSGVTPTTGTKIPVATTTYDHLNLNNGVTYYYIVTSMLNGVESSPSTQSFGIPSVTATGLSIQAIPGNGQVSFSWNTLTGASSYNLYWSTNADMSNSSSQNLTTNSYSLTPLTNGVAIYYQLSATINGTESARTTLQSVTPSAVATLTPPQSIQTSGSSTYVDISWANVATASKYNLYWSTNANMNTSTATKVSNVTSPYRLTLTAGTQTIYFQLTSVASNGTESSPSVTKTYIAVAGNVTTPTGVSATGERLTNYISWNPVSGASKYRVYWSTNSSFTTFNAEGFDETESVFYRHNGVQNLRFYIVTAVGSNGESGSSSIVSATPFYDPVNDREFVTANIDRGARLYYRWFDGATVPAGDHPLWATRAQISGNAFYNTRSGADTWSCMECHGSDYMGATGFYDINNDHYTGFTGVRTAAQNMTYPEVFMRIMYGNNHQFSNKLQLQDVYDLVKFIKEGVTGPDKFLNGDINAGEAFYKNANTPLSCSQCHATPEQKALITNLADIDSPELLHVVRFGKAGVQSMPGNSNEQQVRNVYSYIRSAMVSKFNNTRFDNALKHHADNTRGKALYEDWVAATAQTTPAGRHTLWPAGNSNVTDADTWSCQSCHGPDYLGRNGAYQTGTYATNIKGIVRTNNDPLDQYTSAKTLYDFLLSDTAHGFGTYLNEEDLFALTRFVLTQRTTFSNPAKRGGLLYDKWWTVVNKPAPTVSIDPLQTFPNTPVANTWRCSYCHAWDYSNLLPEARTLNNINDIRAFISTGIAPGKFKPWHKFDTVLNPVDINHLVEFIAGTSSDSILSVANMNNVMINANIDRGMISYQDNFSPSNCASCHGDDGKTLVDIVSIAELDAAEFMHKARYGNPGSSMLPTPKGFIGLSPIEAADILVYLQNGTPGGVPGAGDYATANVARGGRLFDNWMTEMSISVVNFQPPLTSNPLWELRGPGIADISPATKKDDSWRCKTCHAWSYKGIGFGVGGTPSSVSRDNLFARVQLLINDKTKTDDEKRLEVFNWINTGIADYHNYGTAQATLPSALRDRDVWDLTRFLFEGVINVDQHIDTNLQPVGGVATKGESWYLGNEDPGVNCSSCHMADGLGNINVGTNLADIFAVAKQDPWEFLHKVRFGQPGRTMPALIQSSATDPIQSAKDLMSYGQQQFDARTVVP